MGQLRYNLTGPIWDGLLGKPVRLEGEPPLPAPAAVRIDSLDQYKGKPAMVMFFVANQKPSRAGMTRYQTVRDKYAGRPVHVLAVSCGDVPVSSVKGFDVTLVTGGNALAKQFEVNGFPAFVLLDAEGKIVTRIVGVDSTIEDQLSAAIVRALAGK